MSDILDLQDYLYHGMLSCDLFAAFNITQERKFRIDNELEWNAIWQNPRLDKGGNVVDGAKVGAGFYVEMPKFEIRNPNSLQRNLIASVLSIEERNMNFTPAAEGFVGGTMTSAEDLAELALDFMFGWVLSLSSALTPEVAAIAPAYDVPDTEGLVVWRTSVSLRRERAPRARCAPITITDDGAGNYILTNGAATPDADIYFTLDGSFPGKSTGATLYSDPIPLTAGQKITCAAWRADRLPSNITAKLIT